MFKEDAKVKKFIGFMTRDQILFGKYNLLIYEAYLISVQQFYLTSTWPFELV